jgi:IclR family transcriptional regulator, acetate operon repressor
MTEQGTDQRLGRYEVAAVSNALDLLARIGEVGETSTAEAGRCLGISRSSAYRLLVTLQSRGFVEHDRISRRWSLGTPFARMLTRVTETRLRSAALPSMRRLLAEEKETVNLAEFIDDELVYIHILESPQAFRMSNIPGERIPLHATALGKAVIAAHPREQWRSLIASLELEPITANTITDPESLLVELERTKLRGWGDDRSETALGVACFGAPITGPSGLPLGGLSISLPEARLDAGRAERLGTRVLEETIRVSSGIASRTAGSRTDGE